MTEYISTIKDNLFQNEEHDSSDEQLNTGSFKNMLSDPLVYSALIILSIISFVYISGPILCWSIGMFVPLFYAHKTLGSNDQTIVKYFIIYGHIEFILLLTTTVNIYFYHIQVILVTASCYCLLFRHRLIDRLFIVINYYDLVVFNTINNVINTLIKEYQKTKNE